MSTILAFPVNPLMKCPACGTTQEAACKCGVGYVPVGQAAARMAVEHPEMSSRAIAHATGASRMTANRAVQKARVPNGTPLAKTATPLKVVGKDGKRYPARQSKEINKYKPTNILNAQKLIPPEIPWSETKDQEPKILAVRKALSTCSMEDRWYIWQNVLPSFAPQVLYIPSKEKESQT